MVICAGPYIGGIEQELFTFQPYVNWLHTALRGRFDSFYIFSHEPHRFLYNLNGVTFVPVSIELSDDNNHQGLMNSLISNKEYLNLLKNTKHGFKGDDVLQCYVKYTKYDNFVLPLSKKLFRRVSIDLPLESELTGKVILINRGADLNVSKKILSQIDAIEINGHYPFSIEKTLKTIQQAKLVICPTGIWTFFCNLHKVPVVSWGADGIGMYKDNGIYHFNNSNARVIYFDGGNVKPLVSVIHKMVEELK